MNDLRTPIGMFFLMIGAILAATPSAGAPLAEGPVNLYTGGAALLFGAVMVVLGRRAA